jgi:hypothetical protein
MRKYNPVRPALLWEEVTQVPTMSGNLLLLAFMKPVALSRADFNLFNSDNVQRQPTASGRDVEGLLPHRFQGKTLANSAIAPTMTSSAP